MNFEDLYQIKFYVSLGYLVIISSFLTIVVMELIKLFMKKKNIIQSSIDPNKKDYMLSQIGRIVVFIIYVTLYLGNELFVNHHIVWDENLVIGIVTGILATITTTKGIYTALRQGQKRKEVYDKLQETQKQISSLQNQDKLDQSKKIIIGRKEDN